MYKLIITLFAFLYTGQSYAVDGCYHAIVGINGAKNIMNFCFENKETAELKMIYLNDIEKKEAPATCTAMARHKESADGKSFAINSSLGECDNNNIMGKFKFSCKLIEKDLYGCVEGNLKLRFFFSKELRH